METIDFRIVLNIAQQSKGGDWNMTFRSINTTSNARIANFHVPIGDNPMESLLAGLSLVNFDELSRIDITLK